MVEKVNGTAVSDGPRKTRKGVEPRTQGADGQLWIADGCVSKRPNGNHRRRGRFRGKTGLVAVEGIDAVVVATVNRHVDIALVGLGAGGGPEDEVAVFAELGAGGGRGEAPELVLGEGAGALGVSGADEGAAFEERQSTRGRRRTSRRVRWECGGVEVPAGDFVGGKARVAQDKDDFLGLGEVSRDPVVSGGANRDGFWRLKRHLG